MAGVLPPTTTCCLSWTPSLRASLMTTQSLGDPHAAACTSAEPAWSRSVLHVDGKGVFHCAGCGAELFDTEAKFESGTGWPSFDRATANGTIIERQDRSLWMTRTEILCARCGGHLGHVFPDGPTDSGLRYCVNSLSLTYAQDDSAED